MYLYEKKIKCPGCKKNSKSENYKLVSEDSFSWNIKCPKCGGIVHYSKPDTGQFNR